jgi:hypothetical protein
MRLHQNVDHVAVLIHGTPEILLLAVNPNEHFIQVPVVAQPSLSSLQSPHIVRTEFLTPLSDRLIGHDDSSLGQKILDVSETQAEAMVSPDRITDDLRPAFDLDVEPGPLLDRAGLDGVGDVVDLLEMRHRGTPGGGETDSSWPYSSTACRTTHNITDQIDQTVALLRAGCP